MIKREDIEKRVEALKKDLQALDFRMAAVQGAIQDCDYWLSLVDKEEKEEETNAAAQD